MESDSVAVCGVFPYIRIQLRTQIEYIYSCVYYNYICTLIIMYFSIYRLYTDLYSIYRIIYHHSSSILIGIEIKDENQQLN